jgi:sulfur relay (sulfurtransferase) DsrF/TusC family protein
MVDLLHMLSPFGTINAGTKIYSEMDDVNEVMFIDDGSISVGYEINKKERYPMIIKARTLTGIFEVEYNRRSSYIYKAVLDVKGYFIRKSDWKTLA